VDLQVHTCWSHDGYLTLAELDRVAARRGLTHVAITDHDVIDGAVRARELAAAGVLSTRIIVGVEIRTTGGEIIGLFCRGGLRDALDRARAGRLTLAEAVAAIHDDGGLVYLNHPFGYGRRSTQLDFSALEPLWPAIDLVEVFNGHNRAADDARAAELAAAHGKPGGLGSDAHCGFELGRSWLEMPAFDDAQSFLAALPAANLGGRRRPEWLRYAFALRKRPPLRWFRPRPTPAADQRQTPLPGTGVLVTNAGRRKALAVVRSLGRGGIHVIAGETTRAPMTARSRYIGRSVVYPDPVADPDGFLAWVRRLHAEQPFEQLFALDDEVVALVSARRAELPCAVPLPPDEVVQTCLDKARLADFCVARGLPHPRSRRVDGPADLPAAAELGYPLLLKPRRGMGSRGIVAAADESAARAILAAAAPGTYLAQELLPREGAALGYFALMDDRQQVLAEMMHRRLREFPISGGPSTARVSVWEPAAAELGRRLLTELGWSGVAMVEFKCDPRDGQPNILEVNPRFWGSLELCAAAGLEFPQRLYHAARGAPEIGGEARLGVRSRWLVPGELLHIAAQLRRGRWPGAALTALLQPGWRDDLLAADDPGPLLGFVEAAAAKLWQRQTWRDLRRR
jgi:predicted ATP-grasp superfamily ATP-dependent carboligase/predicted metal-dependent phosphoesterase TrpH